MTNMSMPPSPRVFISYSHDSRSHCDRVLEFAQQLRRDGIDAELDQFHQEEPVHWPRWCEERMRPEQADFVLCVCTAEYARRVEGRGAADVGKGVFWGRPLCRQGPGATGGLAGRRRRRGGLSRSMPPAGYTRPVSLIREKPP